MIVEKSSLPRTSSIEIDLTGPEGNAFCVMGHARKIAKKLQYDKGKIDQLMKEMMSGDYEHLVDTFEKEFGDFVVLYR